jgi:uncharacterized protein YgfB (UPF0149 family)
LAIAQGSLEAAELAECHGVACGLLCRLAYASLDEFMGLLDRFGLLNAPGTDLKMSLEELLNSTRIQLADEDMSLTLWLPGDDEMLEERTMALSQWCRGFLDGLGSGDDDALKAMSDDVNEALEDLVQISSADVTDVDESDEDERAFMEVVEYMRVVVLMVQQDLRGPDGQGLIH